MPEPEKETVYTIVIEPRGIGKDHALQLYRFNSSMDLYPNGKLSRNGKRREWKSDLLRLSDKNGDDFQEEFCKVKKFTGRY